MESIKELINLLNKVSDGRAILYCLVGVIVFGIVVNAINSVITDITEIFKP